MQDVCATYRGAASYFKEIRYFPILKAEEERILVARWREGGDRGAAHQLLTSHLRFVAKIARIPRISRKRVWQIEGRAFERVRETTDDAITRGRFHIVTVPRWLTAACGN